MNLTKCPKCGKDNLDNNKFCPNCGFNLENMDFNTNSEDVKAATPWWKTLITAICLFIFPLTIIGLALMWIWKVPAQKNWRIAGTVFFSIFLIYTAFFTTSNDSTSTSISETKISSSEVNDNTDTPAHEDISTPIDTILYDDNGCIITYKGIEKASSGATVKLYFENNSNTNLEFYDTAYSVNGVMIDDIFASSCEVASGKKANMKLDIDLSMLTDTKIDKIKNIEFVLSAYNNDESVSFTSFSTDTIKICTDLDDGKNDFENGTNLYNEKGVSLDSLGHYEGTYKFLITNTSGKSIDFDMINISVNGYSNTDASYQVVSKRVFDGCQYQFSLEISDDFLSDNNIEKIDDVEFSLKIIPEDDITNEYVTEPLTI